MYFNSLIFAIILAASIYGCAHLLNGAKGLGIKKLNWKFAKLTFLLGLPFGIIFAITNSLLIPSLLHAFLVFFMCLTRE
jgi:membrane protease YdiL (CAAX protease family)